MPTEPTHTTPDTKPTTKGFGKVITLVVTVVLVLVLTAYSLLTGPSKAQKVTAATSSITRIMTITKEQSPTIVLKEGIQDALFDFSVIGNNIPFICHYNGGKDQGGWDEEIPARNDHSHNWKRQYHEGTLIAASFELSTNASMAKAQLSYTITPLP